jgi:hypothetical protein
MAPVNTVHGLCSYSPAATGSTALRSRRAFSLNSVVIS